MFSSVQPSSTTDTIVTVKSKCVLELFDNMNFISRESKLFFFSEMSRKKKTLKPTNEQTAAARQVNIYLHRQEASSDQQNKSFSARLVCIKTIKTHKKTQQLST